MRGRAGQCLPTYKGVPHNADKVCSKAAARMKVGHRLNAHPQKRRSKRTDRAKINYDCRFYLMYLFLLRESGGKGKAQRRVYFRFLSRRKISIVLISTKSSTSSCTLVENYKQIDRFLRNRIFQMNEQTDEAQCIFQFFLKKKKEKKTEWLVYTFLSFPDTMSH